ncbi:MAG: NADPH azoreductase [Bacteroidetes bacterium ADurb.Bin217]|nr:MAG: NADPH azoreductase [Bacteroidetes bacterium ADurb.Bin217]
MKILLFSGSNSSESINQAFIEFVSLHIPNHEATVIDLRYFPSPIYSPDLEQKSGKPSAIVALHSLFSSHDAFIIACPEHNGSIPAHFKNTIDWISRIEKKLFQQKPVVLFAVTPGAGGAKQVLSHLTDLIPRWGGILYSAIGIPNYTEGMNFQNYFDINKHTYEAVLEALQKLNT